MTQLLTTYPDFTLAIDLRNAEIDAMLTLMERSTSGDVAVLLRRLKPEIERYHAAMKKVRAVFDELNAQSAEAQR